MAIQAGIGAKPLLATTTRTQQVLLQISDHQASGPIFEERLNAKGSVDNCYKAIKPRQVMDCFVVIDLL
jgi:hypothetical protein